MAITQADIEQLSVKERIDLIGIIWDSIEATSDQIELTQAQKDELDRRMAAYEADHNKGSTWDEVREKMRKAEALDRGDAVEGIRRGLEASDAGR